MNFLPWRKKEETVTDRKYRLAEELAALSEEDAREVVRYARKGFHLAKNQPGGPRKRKDQGNAS